MGVKTLISSVIPSLRISIAAASWLSKHVSMNLLSDAGMLRFRKCSLRRVPQRTIHKLAGEKVRHRNSLLRCKNDGRNNSSFNGDIDDSACP